MPKKGARNIRTITKHTHTKTYVNGIVSPQSIGEGYKYLDHLKEYLYNI